jgi:hypothetical protein
MVGSRRRFRAGAFCLFVLGVSSSGCELDEVTVAEPEDVPVVEGYVMIGDGPDQVSVFLHWTLGTKPATDLFDAEVVLLQEEESPLLLSLSGVTDCVLPGPEREAEGACFTLGSDAEGLFAPGDSVDLEILLEGEQVLSGTTVIPENIDFIQPAVAGRCLLPPGRQLTFVWNRSPGVWAYAAEAEIKGLVQGLALEGIPVETDSVALLGLAVSESDTTIVFPAEFGIFERIDLEQDLAVALQRGLPAGARADVVIAAVDQNYVNWVRGGNFNPSGPVRVSSIRGPGVGVFGSAVRRAMVVVGGHPGIFPTPDFLSCFSDPLPGATFGS